MENSLGILELRDKGSGFVRCREASYLPSNCDVHVGRKLIQQYGLRTGDEIAGLVGKAPSKGKSPPLTEITAVNGRPPEHLEGRPQSRQPRPHQPGDRSSLSLREGPASAHRLTVEGR